MDSLYGGKQGASFVLKASFSSIAEMLAAGKQGSSYTDVWYGEYVIIDTPNKNDADNGKIFCRGLNYQSDNVYGGFEYVGQIVGPSGGTPYMQLNTIEQVKSEATNSTWSSNEFRRYPTGTDDNGAYTISDGKDGAEPAIFDYGTGNALVPGKYVEDNTVKYNDTIKYTWCNIRKDDNDADSWYYVGWQIPYTVIDYSIHMVSPYDTRGNILSDAAEISRIDDATHPYYEHWDLGLPKGVKGDTLRNLRVITLTAADLKTIYDYSQITINSKTGAATLKSGAKPGAWDGASDDVGRQVVVFDYYIFDNKIAPSKITIYLGDFNIITGIEVADNGTLTVSYTHEDDKVFENRIQWVTNVDLTTGVGSKGGHFKLDYNNGAASVERDLTWVRDIDISDTGVITWTYAGTGDSNSGIDKTTGELVKTGDPLKWISDLSLTTGTGSAGGVFTVTYNNDKYNTETVNGKKVGYSSKLTWLKDFDIADNGTATYTYSGTGVSSTGVKTVNNLVKWVTSTSLDPNTGVYTINYNYGDPYTAKLDWVKDISIDESTGSIVVSHTQSGEVTSDAKLKLITEGSTDDTGVVTFGTNTGEEIVLKKSGSKEDYHVKTFAENNAITLATNVLSDKHINVKYNTSTAAEPIGDPINFIQDMIVRPSDYHLLVLFNDPTHRASATDLTNTVDANGVKWVSNQIVKTFYTSPGTADIDSLYWRDYGPVKDDSGILIGFNLTYETVLSWLGDSTKQVTQDNVKAYLDEKYPTGLSNSYPITGGTTDLRGKIVTYSSSTADDENQDKEFYAYDYNTEKWYFLGKIADSGMRDVTLSDSSTILSTSWSNLNTKGLVFAYSATTVSDSSLPSYWDPSYSSWS